MSSQTNFAYFLGIHNFGAAVFFAVAYFLCLPYFIFRAVKRPQYVYIIAAVFCTIRLTAFSMRAAMAKSSKAASDEGLAIGYSILNNVGFFGLLYSVYTLVLDREKITGIPLRGYLARILQNRSLIRILLIVAIAIGITGGNLMFETTKPSTIQTAKDLRNASIYIFLGVTCLLAIQTILVAQGELSSDKGSPRNVMLLSILTLLLVIRESYLAATTNHPSASTNEDFWYPLAALPELLAISILGIPGLVPSRQELQAGEEAKANESNISLN